MYVLKRNGVTNSANLSPTLFSHCSAVATFACPCVRTTQASVAHRKALEMLVHVDDIFAMLRAERPVDESRRLVISMLEHAAKMVQGTAWRVDRDLKALNTTIAELKAHQDLNRASESVFSANDSGGSKGSTKNWIQ